MSDLAKEFTQKSPRALSRAISLAENQDPEATTLLESVYSQTGKSRVIGITGAPGAGKSTLVGELITYLRKKNLSVALLAVDPTSPFTGGALLGDRIRLTNHFNDPKVYIRSLATRGKLGGLSAATRASRFLVDAFGFDYILIETVGVGQNEIDVHKIADLTLLVLGPESGDSIQAMKSGILEIADIIDIHKKDRPGAEKVQQEVENVLKFSEDKRIPVCSSSTSEPESLTQLFQLIETEWEHHSKRTEERRKASVKSTISELVEEANRKKIQEWISKNVKDAQNPYSFGKKLIAEAPWAKV